MTIDEILSQFTILKDCTETNFGSVYWMLIGALIAGFFIWYFIDRFRISSIGQKIVAIFFGLVGVWGIVIGTFYYIKRPVLIDYYISVNDVEIEQISKYFEINELSHINDMMVCHIVPKNNYYEDVLNFRNLNKEE